MLIGGARCLTTRESLDFWNPSRRRRSGNHFSARLTACVLLPGVDKVVNYLLNKYRGHLFK